MMVTQDRIIMKAQGVEIDEEAEGVEAIDRTDVPTSERDTSLVQLIP